MMIVLSDFFVFKGWVLHIFEWSRLYTELIPIKIIIALTSHFLMINLFTMILVIFMTTITHSSIWQKLICLLLSIHANSIRPHCGKDAHSKLDVFILLTHSSIFVCWRCYPCFRRALCFLHLSIRHCCLGERWRELCSTMLLSWNWVINPVCQLYFD